MPRLHLAALLAGLLAGASVAHSAGLCIVPTDGGVNVAYRCDDPATPVSNAVRGYGTTVPEACIVDNCAIFGPETASASVPYCWSISTSIREGRSGRDRWQQFCRWRGVVRVPVIWSNFIFDGRIPRIMTDFGRSDSRKSVIVV